jgi:ankyrin repeat protein
MARLAMTNPFESPSEATESISAVHSEDVDSSSVKSPDASGLEDSVMNVRETVGSTSTLEPTGTDSSESGEGQMMTIASLQNLEQNTIETEATIQSVIEGSKPDDIKCEGCKSAILSPQVFYRCISYGLDDKQNHVSTYAVCQACQPQMKTCPAHGKTLVKSERIRSSYRFHISADEEDADSTMIQALKRRDVRQMESLSSVPGLVNAVDGNKHTALHVACILGYEEEARCLLKNGADLEAKNIQSSTPLESAIIAENYDIVTLLIDNGADKSALNGFQHTPLHTACCRGLLESVIVLLAAVPPHQLAIYVNQQSADGRSALLLAGMNGHVTIARKLLAAGADPNLIALDIEGVLRPGTYQLASSSAGLEIFRLLAEFGADFNAAGLEGWNHLHANARFGRADLCRELFAISLNADRGKGSNATTSRNCKLDPNAATKDGHTALSLAAKHGHVEVVRCLHQFGANPSTSAYFKIPFFKSFTSGGETGLISGQFTSIGFASFFGHTDTVNALLELGVSANELSDDSFTPLYIAADRGHLEVCRSLIDAGADVNYSYVTSVLMNTAGLGRVDIVRLLVSRGATCSAAAKMAVNFSLRATSAITTETRKEIVRLLKGCK